MIKLRTAIIWLLLLFSVSPASAEIRHLAATGGHYYARIYNGSVYFAVALTEGGTGADGNYVANDAAILAAAPSTTLAANLTSGYLFTVRSGVTPSASATDAIVGAERLRWDGTAEDANITTVSPRLVDDRDKWTFDSVNQITSAKFLSEAKSPAVLKSMDFSEPCTEHGAIDHIVSVSIVDVAMATEPTVTSSTLDTSKKEVLILFNNSAATTATYTVKVTAMTTDEQVLIRYGRMPIE